MNLFLSQLSIDLPREAVFSDLRDANLAGESSEDHFLTGTKLYSCWAAMHSRCHSPANPYFCRYGGRGITVCERWNSIHAFLEDMGHPPPGHSIGRIDNDGIYEPSNCRWETQEQQNENTSRNKFVEYDGKIQTIKAWAKQYDLPPNRLSQRLRRGWSIHRALTTPCPRNYEEGRRLHNESVQRMWAKNGAKYRQASQSRKTSDPQPHHP